LKRKPDLRLCLVTDRPLCLGRPLLPLICAAVKGGVGIVQLREKNCATRDFIALARAVKAAVKVSLIINDRADVALACGADGLHIGQGDIPYADARRLLGPRAIIGLTVDTPAQVRAAEKLDADYLGISPVFCTATKKTVSPPWGAEGVQRLRAMSRHRLVAIGGINVRNAAAAVCAGADGVAVVSAICSAENPRRAAAGILKEVRTGLCLRNASGR